jgi:hypothetical protein
MTNQPQPSCKLSANQHSRLRRCTWGAAHWRLTSVRGLGHRLLGRLLVAGHAGGWGIGLGRRRRSEVLVGLRLLLHGLAAAHVGWLLLTSAHVRWLLLAAAHVRRLVGRGCPDRLGRRLRGGLGRGSLTF